MKYKIVMHNPKTVMVYVMATGVPSREVCEIYIDALKRDDAENGPVVSGKGWEYEIEEDL